jgi:CRP-like cAMP-binding protein
MSRQKALHDFLMRPHTISIPRWISPRHYTITYTEVLGHLSFVLVAVSYYSDSFLELRIMAVAGSSCMLFFTYFHPHGRVLWLPFQWNLLFTAINLYRIGAVYVDRFLAERLPQQLIELRNRHFYLMDPTDFALLANHAKFEAFREGDILIAQGEDNPHVRLVLNGRFKVFRDGEFTYLLEEANFVSEVALHAGLFLPGDVESCCTVVADASTTVMTWERDELIGLMRQNAGLRRSLKAIFSWDLVRKLKTQRMLLAAGKIEDPEEWTRLRNEQTKHRYMAILQNFLSHGLIEKRRKELDKYRLIHCISEETHAWALERCGWTLGEFERGYREQDIDTSHQDSVFQRLQLQGRRWYSRMFDLDHDPDQQAGS